MKLSNIVLGLTFLFPIFAVPITSLGETAQSSKAFQDVCERINQVENKYFHNEGFESCVMNGSLGELYALSDIADLNSACKAKGAGFHADIYNNHFRDESTPKGQWENRLIVSCWAPY